MPLIRALLDSDCVAHYKFIYVGNVCLQYVHVAKPLCRRLNITTESGDILIDNLYADESSLVTQSGNVSVRNAHRIVNVAIHQNGNVTVGKFTLVHSPNNIFIFTAYIEFTD